MGARGCIKGTRLFIPTFTGHLVQSHRNGVKHFRVTGDLVVTCQAAERQGKHIRILSPAPLRFLFL